MAIAALLAAGALALGPPAPSAATSVATITSLEVSPTSIGPRGVVVFEIHVSPAPVEPGRVRLRVSNPDLERGSVEIHDLDPDGNATVSVDTNGWPTGPWAGLAEYLGTASTDPSTSDVAAFTITAPDGPPPDVPEPSMIEAGYDYTCATDATGLASCWGRAGHGQGDPPQVEFTEVTAGLYHSCGITRDGHISCWGDPIIEGLDAPDGTYLEVAAGHYHTCATRTDSTLACWVRNPDAQPILEPPFGAFHGLTSGPQAACALDDDDEIHCWGDAQSPPSGPFEQVVVGVDFGCALRIDGTVDCWGSQPDAASADFAALSAGGTSWCGLRLDGSIECAANPAAWAPFSLEGPFDQFAVDWNHICARHVGGSIECWAYASPPDPGTKPYWFSTAPMPATAGIAYDHRFQTSSMWPAATFSITSGSLPPGLSMSEDGHVSGVPTTIGPSLPFTVRASNGIAPPLEAIVQIDVAASTDTTPPKATAPTSKPRSGTNLTSGRITTRIAWTGSDVGSGIARFELAQRTDGGAWTSVSTTLTSPTVDRPLAAGHTYAFRVRAVDKANLTSAWATGATFRLTGYSELSSAVKYSGKWTSNTSTSYWGGKAKSSTVAGSKATFTFTGRSLAIVSRLGPRRGKAEIWIGSTKMATVDLGSTAYSSHRVIWSGVWTVSARRTVTVKVLGTSGRPRVEVDGFIVGS